MKKIILLFLIIFIVFGGCSVQEKMSPEILIERLTDNCESFDFENSEFFTEKSDFICYVKSRNNTDYVFVFSVNEAGDVKKISFSCGNTEKAENFICNIRDMISVYSPEENLDEVIKNITENGKLRKGMSYHENQWYLYSINSDDNGMYFSVTNKKLFPRTSVEYSLKPNDKYDF